MAEGAFALTAEDQVRNAGGVNFTLARDTTAPQATLSVPSPAPLLIPVGWGLAGGETDLRHDDLHTSLDGVAWRGWLTATTATEAIFPGAAGQMYYFRVRATDQVGNVGAWVVVGPVAVDAVTRYYHHGEGRVAMRQGVGLPAVLKPNATKI